MTNQTTETTAALSYGPAEPFTLHTVELSPPRDNEVLVRLEAVGICHTDLGSKAFSPDGTPALFGHEGAGVIEAVGSAVSGLAVGQKVLMSYNSCGVCAQCSHGHRAYCEQFNMLNASGARPDGSTPVSIGGEPVRSAFFGQSSFARHAIATVENVVPVDDDVDLSLAAPMGCGFQTGAGAVVNVLRPTSASRVVVYGAGGVGMAAVMAARAMGAETVIAVDLSARRRELALEIGATHALDGADENLSDEMRKITGGGATHALDTTAVPAVITGAVQTLAPLGTLVLVGIGAPEVALNVLDLIGSGKTVRGCIEGDATPSELIPRLLAWQREGKFPVERIISTYPFEDINDAVADMREAVVKPVLRFSA
jgi:aryl-alcohol dehydrogenase